MKKHLWKILIGIGILPILLPFILGVYHVNIESWTMGGWLIMYSYVYWPTYVLGLALIIVGVIKRKKVTDLAKKYFRTKEEDKQDE